MDINDEWTKWFISTIPGVLILALIGTFLAHLIKVVCRWIFLKWGIALSMKLIMYQFMPLALYRTWAKKLIDENQLAKYVLVCLLATIFWATETIILFICVLVSAFYIVVQEHHDRTSIFLFCFTILLINFWIKDFMAMAGACSFILQDHQDIKRKLKSPEEFANVMNSLSSSSPAPK